MSSLLPLPADYSRSQCGNEQPVTGSDSKGILANLTALMWGYMKSYIWGLEDYCFQECFGKCQKRERGMGRAEYTYCYSYNDEMLERHIQRWKMTLQGVLCGRNDEGMMNDIKGTITECVLDRSGIAMWCQQSLPDERKSSAVFCKDVLFQNCLENKVRRERNCFRHNPSIQCHTKSTQH